MAKISRSIEIGAPVDQVYAFLTNPNNLTEIWPSMIEVSNVDRKEDGSHSFAWLYKMAGVHFRGQAATTAVEKNKRVVVKNQSGIPSEFEYLYESVGGKTRLTMNVDYTIPGQLLSKVADHFVRRINENEAETLLQNLKARMEVGAPEEVQAAVQ